MGSGREPRSSATPAQPQPAPGNGASMHPSASAWSATAPVLGSAGLDFTSNPSTTAHIDVWSPGNGSSVVTSTCGPLESNFVQASTDPDLDAIFAELFPTLVYDDPFATVGHQLYPTGQLFDGGAGLGLS